MHFAYIRAGAYDIFDIYEILQLRFLSDKPLCLCYNNT